MKQSLRQPVIIDNRPGGMQLIGLQALMLAPPDGYTLASGNSAVLVYNPLLNNRLPYDVERDFTPISLVVRFSLVAVAGAQTKHADVQELLKAAQAEPGTIAYGTQGVGSPNHLIMEPPATSQSSWSPAARQKRR
ncbi:MAG: Bug family tripartite tricarboxylate transporter substrate binding protein [Candidatus Melainabacteria bacterium]